MTQDEIIALAKECGFVSLDIEIIADKAVPMFEAFYHAAQRQAYERALKILDETDVDLTSDYHGYVYEEGERYKRDVTDAIRALIEGDGK